MIIYRIKLFVNLLNNKLFTRRKYKNMIDYLDKNLVKYFKNNYKYLVNIFEDLDNSIIIEGENYLLRDDYFEEYFILDFRLKLGMFIRGKYIYKREEIKFFPIQDAEKESFDMIIGYIFYLNKSFKIFCKKTFA